MRNGEDAKRATENLNGSVVNGRVIEVNVATPRKSPSRPLYMRFSNSTPTYESPTTPRSSYFLFPR